MKHSWFRKWWVPLAVSLFLHLTVLLMQVWFVTPKIPKRIMQDLPNVPKKIIYDANLVSAKEIKKVLYQREQIKIQKELALKKAREEKARKLLLEKRKIAQQKALEKKKKQELEKARLEKARLEKAKREQEKQQAVKLKKEWQQKELLRYSLAIKQKIEENRVYLTSVPEDTQCVVKLILKSDGYVKNIVVLKPSFNPAFDEMQLSSIYKSAPFTMPEDKELFEQLQEIVLTCVNGESS